jgi:malonyl-CoA decarboxylase
LDPVAHFHVQNGAEIYDIHFESDTSRAGMARSFGIMANYLYSLEDIENNRRKYIANQDMKINEKILQFL